MIRRWGLAACACVMLCQQAGAQSFVSMGRLFSTPGERGQLDRQRDSPGAVQYIGPQANLPGAAGNLPPPMPAPVMQGVMPQAAQLPAPPAPQPTQLGGVIRRSNGQVTVVVDNEARDGVLLPGGRGVALQVDGRQVILKPGQSYDPATGEVHENGR